MVIIMSCYRILLFFIFTIIYVRADEDVTVPMSKKERLSLRSVIVFFYFLRLHTFPAQSSIMNE